MSKEVLIVDDDVTLVRSMARAVEKLGYRTRTAHDGYSALSAVASQLPDLILLDILLPKKDGHSVLRELQLSERTRPIAVLVMSGVLRGRNAARDVEAAGARGFLAKPFTASDLAAWLHRLLGPAKPAADPASSEDIEHIRLAEVPVAEILWKAMREGFTGAIHFRHEKRQKTLVLVDGRPRSVRSNLAKETLARRLLAAGTIDERMVREIQRRAASSGRRHGELLLELGALTPPVLERALREQAREKLVELFTWDAGEAWHEPGLREVTVATELPDLPPEAALLEGIGQMSSSHLQRFLGAHAECEVVLDPERIGPEAKAAAASLLDALGADPARLRVGALAAEHGPMVYGLALLGAIELRGDANGVAVASHRAIALESELRELARRFEGATHFEVLGVASEASEAEIRRAFLRLAKRYHPDKITGAAERVRPFATELFARIAEAHQVLSDPAQRRQYEARLANGTGGTRSASHILTAEAHFGRAEDLLRRKEYAAALTAIDAAIRIDPEEGEFHALHGWLLFLEGSGEDGARRRAIECLEKATALSPNSPAGFFYLGKLYKACEDPSRAVNMFRRVLDLRPEHVEAAQEIRVLELRREPGGAASRFGFGRKNKTR